MDSRSLGTLELSTNLVSILSGLGYETVDDLKSTSEVDLAQELSDRGNNVPACLRAYFSGSSYRTSINDYPQYPRDQNAVASQILAQSVSSQPASALLAKPHSYTTPSSQLNRLLAVGKTGFVTAAEEGLRSLHVLEIAGPPGSGKASITMELIRSALEKGQRVLIAETQSSLTASRVAKSLQDNPISDTKNQKRSYLPLVKFMDLVSMAHFLAFVKAFPTFLDNKDAPSLLILSHLSFLFQFTSSSTLSNLDKARILGITKDALTRACMENGITVIITNQTATKMVGNDGTAAKFETGAKGLLVSSIGSVLFSPSRSIRILLSRDQFGTRHAQHVTSTFNQSIAKSKLNSSDPDQGGLGAGSTQVSFLIDKLGRICDP